MSKHEQLQQYLSDQCTASAVRQENLTGREAMLEEVRHEVYVEFSESLERFVSSLGMDFLVLAIFSESVDRMSATWQKARDAAREAGNSDRADLMEARLETAQAVNEELVQVMAGRC